MSTQQILDAVELAVLYHGDQRYGRYPYIVHPIAVAAQVSERGGTEAQIIAAILHDTVEDTDLPIEAISLTFGLEVAAIVSSLTHDSDVPYDDYISSLDSRAVLVKLCDSICNRDMLNVAEMTAERKARLTKRYTRNINALSVRLPA